TNFGPFPATSVTLTDFLPAAVSFASATSSQGACTAAGGRVTCNLGNVAINGGAVVTILAAAMADGPITNVGQGVSAEADIAAANNLATLINTNFVWPNITTPPQSQSATNGSTVMFSVNAVGTALRYQWRHDGGDLPGATNAILVLAGIQLSDAGAYTV